MYHSNLIHSADFKEEFYKTKQWQQLWKSLWGVSGRMHVTEGSHGIWKIRKCFPKEMTANWDFTVRRRWRDRRCGQDPSCRQTGQNLHTPGLEGVGLPFMFLDGSHLKEGQVCLRGHVSAGKLLNAPKSCSCVHQFSHYILIDEVWPWDVDADKPEAKPPPSPWLTGKAHGHTLTSL